jgi:hypothetical protein
MSEKVKLSKNVCDALNQAKGYNIEIIKVLTTWEDKRTFYPFFEPLLGCDVETIRKALEVGYESELTAEEQMKIDYFATIESPNFDYGDKVGCVMGVRNALRIHGIYYDWLED